MISPELQAQIVDRLRLELSALMGVYAFGSRIRGDAHADSDLDLAVLVEGYADRLMLWDLAGQIADLACCPVDLLDLRAASTVMQYQIIAGGECWWRSDTRAALFEAAALSEKTELDEARAPLLADIGREGKVYGR